MAESIGWAPDPGATFEPSPALEDGPFFSPVEGPPILDEAEDAETIRAVFPRAEVVVRGLTD